MTEIAWVKVTDRLPGIDTAELESEPVLTYVESNVEYEVGRLTEVGGRKVWDYERNPDWVPVDGAGAPTHWMPLPEPPDV